MAMEDDVAAALNINTEDEGLAVGFYDLLWKKKNDKHERQCKYQNFSVNIPDTIVYNFSKPQYWYFTSRSRGEEKRVKKKKRQNLNSKTILEKFLPARSKSGIAAVYMWNNDAASYNLDEGIEPLQTAHVHQNNFNIMYLDAEGLRSNLLRLGQISNNGILQAFVDPKPRVDGAIHNSMIQTYWQPNHIHFERRQNKHSLTDNRFSYEARAETFEGTFENSDAYPLVSAIILDEIKTINNMIAEHLWYVADCGVKRMVCNFKIDENNKVWFLFCSSISVVERDTVYKQPMDLLAAVGPKTKKQEREEREERRKEKERRSKPLLGRTAEETLDRVEREAAYHMHKLQDMKVNSMFDKIVSNSRLLKDNRRPHSQLTTTTTSSSERPHSGLRGTTPGSVVRPLSAEDELGLGPSASRAVTPMSAVSMYDSPQPEINKAHQSSALKEKFTDFGWSGGNEALKRILFDSNNFLSASQR
eukprot:TRINITY_DN21121_c0_g1_i1.p1 TRINITY_DN21121_c0_g1~~TRINITY_DN21121_c0_g1_i1.p1  ORF type:complete len:474 (+),score=70.16 TRINITY_DN21121_c0_g1_i1:47-1468(+)